MLSTAGESRRAERECPSLTGTSIRPAEPEDRNSGFHEKFQVRTPDIRLSSSNERAVVNFSKITVRWYVSSPAYTSVHCISTTWLMQAGLVASQLSQPGTLRLVMRYQRRA